MNNFTMNKKDFDAFIALLNKHNIDLKSEKAMRLFDNYKKVIG